MNVTVEQNPGRCEILWRHFSPLATLFDVWEFRATFADGFERPPFFVVAWDHDIPVGLLPLWWVEESSAYFWWGDTGDECHWQEENQVWARDDDVLALLLASVPRPCILNNVTPHAAEALRPHGIVERANDKQILTLSPFETTEDYLLNLPKKQRSTVRGAVRKMEALEPHLVLNDPSHLAKLIQFNRARFPDSPLSDPRLVRSFERLFLAGQRSPCPYQSQLMAVCVGPDVAGVDLIFMFNGIYTPYLCGNRVDRFPGVGHFLNLHDINDAILRGFDTIDFLESDPGSYKESFFETIPQFKCSLR